VHSVIPDLIVLEQIWTLYVDEFMSCLIRITNDRYQHNMFTCYMLYGDNQINNVYYAYVDYGMNKGSAIRSLILAISRLRVKSVCKAQGENLHT
jgi:hypothetical protein